MTVGGTTIAGLATTRVGFGTSRLHYARDAAGRERVLCAAYEAGIRHFDTAPVYGHGLAERALGAFAASRRDCIVVAKHGISASPWIGALPGPLVRPALLARAAANRARGGSRPLWLTPATLRRSVEASLRRLRREVIDVHLLHEPDPSAMADPAAVFGAYEAMIAEGKIRAAGVSGAYAPALELLGHAPPSFVLQTGEDEWTEARVPDVTYGAVSRAPQSRRQANVGEADARARLRMALDRRSHGVVLVSTTRPAHLRGLLS
ncbi:aldo/keto reductase [Acuticoccus sp.]|uniref:aldo/keto reductase n=1 Tax=Acuticoccus sp. TaxID=1904378 RepID=UPI003B51EFE1